MFKKSKNKAKFSRAEFLDRLDALLSAAENAGIRQGTIADILEKRVQTYHSIEACQWNPNLVPNMTVIGGNPSIRDRIGEVVEVTHEKLVAAMRGE